MRKASLLSLCLFMLASLAWGQQYAYRSPQTIFGSPGNGQGLRVVGTGAQFHQLTWNIVGGTLSACQIQVDSSSDGISWTSAGVIASTLCTSNGGVTSISTVVNYVRINVTAMTGTGTVVALLTGYANNPAGGGGGTVTNTLGALTLNAPVLGNAGSDTKVSTGINTNGASELDLGLNGTAGGVLGLMGATSGKATISPPAVAGTVNNPIISSNALQLPAGSNTIGTVALSFAGNAGFYSPAVNVLCQVTNSGSTTFCFNGLSMSIGSNGAFTMTSGAANGTSDTGMSRNGGGVIAFGTGSAGNTTGRVQASSYMSTGTKFTTNAGCTEGTLVGGGSAGKFTVGQATACTTVITMGDGASAPNGWACFANDQTAVPATAIRQTASTTTTATLSMTVATSDVVSFHCVGY